jgi:putative Mg2+ transporter-C (MgtC) family protein
VPVFDRDVLIQVGLSIALGGLIGLERELRGRAAGFRTMILVCVGSTLVMIVSARLSTFVVGGTEGQLVRADPGRIAAGIVTGIGFLGAGVIVKLGDVIRGVTTAATIWFVAAIGIAIGDRHYVLSVFATAAALGVLVPLQYIERRLQSHVYRALEISAASEQSTAVLEQVRALIADRRMRVMELKASENVPDRRTKLIFHLRLSQHYDAHEIVRRVAGIGGVEHVDWR